MDETHRCAVFYAPREGDFATAAAAWLGRDAITGTAAAHPDLGIPLADLTAAPRRYGFHGTLRAPFRIADGFTLSDVTDALQKLADHLPRVVCDSLRVEQIDGFLALMPQGGEAELNALAAEVVTGTDAMRAPLSGDEITRRHPETLTPRQRDLMYGWGYPFVMEEFRFHLTLTQHLLIDQIAPAQSAAEAWFAPHLPRPFQIDDLCLFGEDTTGHFRLLHRYPLLG